MRHHIICYDISHPKRLRQVHKYLSANAFPLQYSVFWLQANGQQLQRHLQKLQTLIDPKQDDLRAYPLPKRGLRWHIGPTPLPEGIHYRPLRQHLEPTPRQNRA